MSACAHVVASLEKRIAALEIENADLRERAGIAQDTSPLVEYANKLADMWLEDEKKLLKYRYAERKMSLEFKKIEANTYIAFSGQKAFYLQRVLSYRIIPGFSGPGANIASEQIQDNYWSIWAGLKGIPLKSRIPDVRFDVRYDSFDGRAWPDEAEMCQRAAKLIEDLGHI